MYEIGKPEVATAFSDVPASLKNLFASAGKLIVCDAFGVGVGVGVGAGVGVGVGVGEGDGVGDGATTGVETNSM